MKVVEKRYKVVEICYIRVPKFSICSSSFIFKVIPSHCEFIFLAQNFDASFYLSQFEWKVFVLFDLEEDIYDDYCEEDVENRKLGSHNHI